jgi:hypothetical protein
VLLLISDIPDGYNQQVVGQKKENRKSKGETIPLPAPAYIDKEIEMNQCGEEGGHNHEK